MKLKVRIPYNPEYFQASSQLKKNGKNACKILGTSVFLIVHPAVPI